MRIVSGTPPGSRYLEPGAAELSREAQKRRQWFDHYQAHGRNAAWAWLNKLRRAMARPGRERLAGPVEVDETYLGGLEEGKRGRQTEKKALIVVPAREDGRSIGRIRM